MESMYEKNKLVEEYIENRVKEVNVEYYNMIDDSYIDILKNEFLYSGDSLDAIISDIDNKIDE